MFCLVFMEFVVARRTREPSVTEPALCADFINSDEALKWVAFDWVALRRQKLCVLPASVHDG